MLYGLFQAQEAWLARLRPLARRSAGLLRALEAGQIMPLPLREAAASLQLAGDTGTSHSKPAFGLASTRIDGRTVAVREEEVQRTPFGRLLRFAKDTAEPGPRLLVVAPMSGHFATRLRGTVEALLPGHDVHVTDWTDAQLIPPAEGPFGLDEQVAHLIAWLEAIGPGGHLLAVSQPGVACLAAAAIMAEDGSPARPRSLTLIGTPIDPRIDPTREESLARTIPLSWFEAAEVATVTPPHPGAGRRVRPGTQQYGAAVMADLNRHLAEELAQLRNLALDDRAAAEAHRRRSAELRAVTDVPAELYLDTVRRVFQLAELARGRMRWRGRPVRPETIRDTAVLVVEGTADGSCPPGQARAAYRLCAGLPEAMRRYHLQPDATHDALFEGRAWETEICPLVREVTGAA